MVFLQEGGDQILRQYIAEELAKSAIDPKEEMRKLQTEHAGLKKVVDRLLDNLSAANRDFVDEKLAALRPRLRELEARQKDLETVAKGSLDVEAATAQALAQVQRFREVAEQGSIVEQKEFLRGLIAGITLHPAEHRGVITYYDLLPASFKCHGGSRPKLYRRMRHYGIPIQFGRAVARTDH